MSLKEGWIATCVMCSVNEVVCGPNTPGGAMAEAEGKGWYYHWGTNQWYCPICRYDTGVE